MLSHVSTGAIFVLAFLGAVEAAPGFMNLQGRADSCRADNCLRALRNPDRAATATPFCQAYLGIATGTTTVSTVSPSTLIQTTATSQVTQIYSHTEYQTNSHTSYVDTTNTITTTSTTTLAYPALSKRTNVPVPDFMQAYAADPSRISSACKCLGVPTPSVTVTYTAPTQTNYQTSTALTTISLDTTSTISTDVTTVITNPTSTATVVVPTSVVKPFYLKSSDGKYLVAVFGLHTNNGRQQNMVFNADQSQAVKFSLTSSGTLSYTDAANNQGALNPFVRGLPNQNAVTFRTANNCQGSGCNALTFSLDGNTLVSNSPYSSQQICPRSDQTYVWSVVKTGGTPASGCTPVTLTLEFAN